MGDIVEYIMLVSARVPIAGTAITSRSHIGARLNHHVANSVLLFINLVYS